LNAWHWIAGALLVAGVAVQVLACVGLLRGRDPLDRLHLVAPAAALGGPLVCAAVLVNESFSQGGIKAIIVGCILLASGPVLGHATARAVRLRATRHVTVLPSEARQAHRS
jgi:multisubunit Na+/H+ antiporter MnhG subunit